MIIGFGQPHFDETMRHAKELAAHALVGDDDFDSEVGHRQAAVTKADALAYFHANVLARGFNCATVRVTQMHINRQHPFSPDGVAGLSVTAMAVAYRQHDDTVIVAAGTAEPAPEGIVPEVAAT